MAKASRDFQVFAKPVGAQCNLGCAYCYYLSKKGLYPQNDSFRMPGQVLEEYIRQHIEASPSLYVYFSWHGGEPTIRGLDFFRRAVALQKKYCDPVSLIYNGIQTNGTLLDEEWCGFLAEEKFAVGLSLDGPPRMHDRCRITKQGGPTHEQVMRGYNLLRRHQVNCDILCVVGSHNVRHPAEIYEYFQDIGARSVTFLPLVEHRPGSENCVSGRSVPAEDWGDFLCTVFDLWKEHDVGQVNVQIIDEMTRPAMGREQTLCIFKETCGDVPVIEHNGDFYSCDHFVDDGHRLGNIMETHLVDLLESPGQRAFGRAKQDTLPAYCRECEVLDSCNGECPKNRFISAPDGEPGLNYLCTGYKRFFTHCRPFLSSMQALWKRLEAEVPSPPPPDLPEPSPKKTRTPGARKARKIGRNDPCPCGSGKKYKKCCLGK